jgi:hypothetical protein
MIAAWQRLHFSETPRPPLRCIRSSPMLKRAPHDLQVTA